MNIKHILKKKGWLDKEISKAHYAMKYAEKRKSKTIKIFDKLAFWMVLIFILIGNAILSLVVIPVVMGTNAYFTISFVALIAYVFGHLFEFLMRDLEHIDHRHHIIAGTIIPVLAMFNVYVSTMFGNYLIETIPLQTTKQNPLLLGAVFVVFFMTPYLIRMIKIYAKK